MTQLMQGSDQLFSLVVGYADGTYV